jgi:3-oxoacyl-[acyl-carrier-protein] synthase II
MKTRVVITGLGVVSPIGIGVKEFWKAAMEGRQIENFDLGQYLDFPQGGRVDRFAQFALVAAKEALADSGLRMDREEPHRVGVIVGAGMGGMVMGEREVVQLYQQLRPHRVHPNLIPAITLNSASGILAMAYGAKGPNLTISTACSSSAHALGQAMNCIRNGQADTVIAAGADASITPLAFAGFCSLRALSTKFNETPTKASRPFDRLRDGFVLGEGAGALILESLSHAKKRKARVYAEVAGYGATSEAYHMVIPREDGMEIAETIRLALKDAGIAPAQVDYINAHATSTPVGDNVEIKGIRQVFKSRAEKVAINSTKSLIGHTLGAAGAIGGIATALSIETGQIHPTINYDEPDPECKLPGISRSSQKRPVKVALVNSFGFGSNNAAVVFRKLSLKAL